METEKVESPQISVCTIGFTGTSAEDFFSRLRSSGSNKIIDVRLRNTSQLAGFAKARDLKFFLQSICGMGYEHAPELAPTPEILDAFKKRKGEWSDYEIQFMDLMDARHIDQAYSPDFFDKGCLLCSEATPHHCHRRLVVEFLNDRWETNLVVNHL